MRVFKCCDFVKNRQKTILQYGMILKFLKPLPVFKLPITTPPTTDIQDPEINSCSKLYRILLLCFLFLVDDIYLGGDKIHY